MLPVQPAVPVPPRIEPKHKTKYPLAEMEVGAMFFVPGLETNTLANYVSAAGKRLGRKFRTRLCIMMQDRKGNWALAHEAGGELGVAVWRIK